MEFKRFIFSLLVVGVLSSAATSTARLVGGYNPIKDPKDPYVVEIGKFAVSEHDKKASDNLVFVSVVSGEEQVVAGTNYKLNIMANIPNLLCSGKVYQAVVYDGLSEMSRKLISFTKSESNDNSPQCTNNV